MASGGRTGPGTRCAFGRASATSGLYGLKKRLGAASRPRRKARKPAFVELMAPRATMLREYLIEFESLRGSKVRIPWKGAAPPDGVSLLRAGPVSSERSRPPGEPEGELLSVTMAVPSPTLAENSRS